MSAYAGLQARLDGSAGLTAVLATDPETDTRAALQGWPTDLLELPAAAFPRLTWFEAGPGENLNGPNERRYFQLDLWAWPDGAGQGDDALDAIDLELDALFMDRIFVIGGRRYSATSTPSYAKTTAPHTPLRRTRQVTLLICDALG